MKTKNIDFKKYFDTIINKPQDVEKFLKDSDKYDFNLDNFDATFMESFSDSDIIKMIEHTNDFLNKILDEVRLKVVGLSFKKISKQNLKKELIDYLYKINKLKNYYSLIGVFPSLEPFDRIINYINNELSFFNKYSNSQSKEYDKINWLLTFKDFAFLIGQLKENGFIKDTYENLSNHFLVQGEEINPINLKNTISKLKSPNTDDKPSSEIENTSKELIKKASIKHL